MKLTLDKWIVVISLILGTIVQGISTSSVNVSLTQIMGNLGASLEDVSWVVTAYTAANVIMVTLSGWMSIKFGEKKYFIASIVVFTLASVFCGISTNLPELIAFRILQGLGGGGLITVAQSLLIKTFPKEQLGMANAIFLVGMIVGPSIGPTLGGYVTDNLSWHWVFFINVPVGIVAAVLSYYFIKEPQNSSKSGNLDWYALVLLTVAIGGLQIVLSKGQSEDWFESKYIIFLTIAFIVGGVLFVTRQIKAIYPILDLRLLKNMQFAVGILFCFIQGIGLYASVFIIPIFCQTLLGYTSQQTGWIMLPGSLAAGVIMPFVPLIIKKTGISPVTLSGVGFTLFIVFVWRLSGMNLDTNAGDFFWPLIIRGIALGLLFVPLLTITLFPLHGKDISQGSALSNMVRQLGGSFGIALATTFISTRSIFHLNRLCDHISIFNQSTFQRIHSYTNFFFSKGGDSAMAHLKAMAAIKGSVAKQAMLLTYNDTFLVVGICFAVCIPLLLLFRVKGSGINLERVEEKVESHIID